MNELGAMVECYWQGEIEAPRRETCAVAEICSLLELQAT